MKLSRTFYISVFCAIQLILLSFVLIHAFRGEDDIKVDLESRPADPNKAMVIPESALLGTVSLFTGPDYDGIEQVTRARKYLSFGEGQMMWILLSRPLFRSDEPFRGEPSKSVVALDKHLPDSIRDGVVNFLYDVGSNAEISYSNWNSTAVRELQASSLLPWQKYLDFVALSCLEDGNAGALPFISNINPNILLIVPPVDAEYLTKIGNYKGQPNLWKIDLGAHRILPGLWALVLPVEGRESRYEMDLVVERNDGTLTLMVGAALNPPLVHLQRAEEELGKKVSLYVGATGWIYDDDMFAVEAEFMEIDRRYPNLHWQPNNNTGMVVRGFLEDLLGERYHSGRLGSRLRCE